MQRLREANGYRIGAGQVNHDLSSAANSRLARGWLEECRTTHKSCLREITPELPSRMVDVGHAAGSSPLRCSAPMGFAHRMLPSVTAGVARLKLYC